MADLEFKVVDQFGNTAAVSAKGLKVKVDVGRLNLSTCQTEDSEATMPEFALVLKQQGKGSAAAAAAQSSETKISVKAAGLERPVSALSVEYAFIKSDAIVKTLVFFSGAAAPAALLLAFF